MFDETIIDISKFVRNFERAIPGETIFWYDVFPLTDRTVQCAPAGNLAKKFGPLFDTP